MGQNCVMGSSSQNSRCDECVIKCCSTKIIQSNSTPKLYVNPLVYLNDGIKFKMFVRLIVLSLGSSGGDGQDCPQAG